MFLCILKLNDISTVPSWNWISCEKMAKYCFHDTSILFFSITQTKIQSFFLLKFCLLWTASIVFLYVCVCASVSVCFKRFRWNNGNLFASQKLCDLRVTRLQFRYWMYKLWKPSVNWIRNEMFDLFEWEKFWMDRDSNWIMVWLKCVFQPFKMNKKKKYVEPERRISYVLRKFIGFDLWIFAIHRKLNRLKFS